MKLTRNNFRIIGGQYRSRKFNFPDVKGLRPTPNKVRETLFNWIGFESTNKTYLDLFCGSGSLSFEALSRGAKQVIGIEQNLAAFQALQQNSCKIASEKIQFINQDSLKYLTQTNQQSFNFVFLDPPFHQNILPKILQLLSSNNFVSTGSKIYIESENEILLTEISSLFSTDISIIKQKKSGQVHYCLIKIGSDI